MRFYIVTRGNNIQLAGPFAAYELHAAQYWLRRFRVNYQCDILGLRGKSWSFSLSNNSVY